VNDVRKKHGAEQEPPGPPAAYEPPAIAWDEPFEPLSAGSLAAPNGPNFMSQLQRCDIL
jgi:hypothetical protein